jgi:hypothetical protein
MNETIRDYIKRYQKLSWAIWAIGLALLLVPSALNRHGGPYLWMRLAGLVVLGVGPTLMGRVKCPKCSKPLGLTVMGRNTKADTCPSCGVNFDEPLPHKLIS